MTAGGGYVWLPDGSVVVALRLPHPAHPPSAPRVPELRVLVHSVNRQRALTRLRNLGFHGVHLRGNADPPTPDEITAVLHHPEGLVWRASEAGDTDLWQPVSTLLRADGG
jgi:hypothetical protein